MVPVCLMLILKIGQNLKILKGKKTRVNCILRELYGSGIEKLKMDRHEVSFFYFF